MSAHLNFPALVADTLTRLPDRQAHNHAAVFLAYAARLLSRHPYRDMSEACLMTDGCLPLLPGAPLCALCAVDRAVDRHANGFPDSTIREFRAVGTVCKQAIADMLEANPELPREEAPERVALDLSSRLTTGDLTPLTAAEAADRADRLVCLRAIARTGLGGRVVGNPSDRVMASLVRRGWVAGGYITSAGQFAREQAHRDEMTFRRSRAAAQS